MPASKKVDQTSDNTKTLVTALALFFCYPVGLILMWAWTSWSQGVKIAVTIVGVLYLIFTIAILATAGFVVFHGVQQRAMYLRQQNQYYPRTGTPSASVRPYSY